MNAYIKFGEILSICPAETKFWHKSRTITLLQMWGKMTCNNPKLDLVNMNAYIKFGDKMSVSSQDIKQKPNFGVSQGP